MNTPNLQRHVLAALRRPMTALTVAAVGATGLTTGVSTAQSSAAPVVITQSGVVQGMAISGGYTFRGLPYAAPPTGNLRWRAPQPPAAWTGVRDATQFAPSCPQQPSLFQPPGAMSEDCLYLNVSTPVVHSRQGGGLPVLVWIHGGGFTEEGGRNYDPTKLAADGIVVVTINYRLGALGFLAHPALASQPGGPAGNYGLMDQQAALLWVQRNIAQFGGNPENITIAGQSAGGVSVLAQFVSPGARGLFQRAIVQSGAFALTQVPLAAAETFGEGFASQVGCTDQTAACLRSLPVSTLVNDFPGAAIPGIVDGQVLTESIGTALAAGRFSDVPILDGSNHDEERLFVADLGVAVSGGMFVGVPSDTYQNQIAAVLGVSGARAQAIATEYPLSSYPSQTIALSTLVADANFACTAFQVDRLTSQHVPTFAYEFNDDAAPPRYAPTNPPVATHESEVPYLFDLPNAPLQGALNPDQETLAATMRAAWASFAAGGDPSTDALPWPSFNGNSARVMSLVPPQPQRSRRTLRPTTTARSGPPGKRATRMKHGEKGMTTRSHRETTTSISTSIQPRFRTIDGLQIRCAESAAGGRRELTVLLTSPWPESLYAYAPRWATLAEHARLVAIDLPGFGASERRDDLLSPRAMGTFLAQLIVEADLGRPQIVAPDVGTSAALFAAAAHPERIASVVVGTGGAAVPLQLGEPLKSWVPDSRLRIIDAGHFVWEEAPAEYALRLRRPRLDHRR